MPPQHHVILEVHRIGFRKRPSGTELGHNLHRFGIFHFALARHRDILARQQRIPGDHRRHDVLIVVAAGAFIIVGH